MTDADPPGWLSLSSEALALGVTASAITYTLVSMASSTAATGTGLVVDAAGACAAAATRSLWGDLPAMTIRVLGRMGSKTSEESVRRGGTVAATALAALVGGTTVITVTVGSRLLHATVEYGGALTKEVAERVAAAFLTRNQTEEPCDSVWRDDDSSWAVLEST